MGHDSPHGPQEKGCPWWMIPPRRSRADGCGDLHTHVVHALLHQPEHLLKLPLEGLQEFLQDTLARALEDEACPCSCRPPWLSYPGWSKTCPCPEPRGWRPSGLFSKLGWLCHAWPHGPTLCRPNILEEKLTLFTYS
ncbi:unnamed protein product [Rangifer tarandus platyrhynchus]|uniref:Uncharacterized protein n=1 Tax=Rangifer tarandus platyrhynchus TaxID=3082113 RepID=A0ABN8Z7Z9_RANTA|nr:unnamed protein product [Rangifer tarandus platyrhynchus]